MHQKDIEVLAELSTRLTELDELSMMMAVDANTPVQVVTVRGIKEPVQIRTVTLQDLLEIEMLYVTRRMQSLGVKEFGK